MCSLITATQSEASLSDSALNQNSRSFPVIVTLNCALNNVFRYRVSNLEKKLKRIENLRIFFVDKCETLVQIEVKGAAHDQIVLLVFLEILKNSFLNLYMSLLPA